MIAIILAGGYAKRLWPLTLDKPKALLDIDGRPIIDYIMDKIVKEKKIKKTIISTNLRFQHQFENWLSRSKYENTAFIPDESTSQDTKIGVVKTLANIASTIYDDFIVLAADSLFKDELDKLIEYFYLKQSPVVGLYNAHSLQEVKRGSEVNIDHNGKIIQFVEKPKNPKSKLIGSCIYVFPANVRESLFNYVESGYSLDEAGNFISWLYKKEPVYGFILNSHLLDIGTIDAYKEAQDYFE